MAGLICGSTDSAAVTMQVALHLNDVEHEMFSRWLASTAIAVDPDNPHLEASEAISAMIRVTMRYAEITGQVASQLRLERAAAKDRKAPPIINHGPGHDRPPLISLSETRYVAALYGRAGER